VESKNDIFMGIRISREMALAVEKARAKRGMRSSSAFCRESIAKALTDLGICYRPQTPADAPLFMLDEELLEREAPTARETETPTENARDGQPQDDDASESIDNCEIAEEVLDRARPELCAEFSHKKLDECLPQPKPRRAKVDKTAVKKRKKTTGPKAGKG
jgi:hypothetical protein